MIFTGILTIWTQEHTFIFRHFDTSVVNIYFKWMNNELLKSRCKGGFKQSYLLQLKGKINYFQVKGQKKISELNNIVINTSNVLLLTFHLYSIYM